MKEWNGITFFTDAYLGSKAVTEVKSTVKVAWLVEPRAINSGSYETVRRNAELFDLILTHDERLIEELYPKARFVPASRVWTAFMRSPQSKSNMVSMIYSAKRGLAGYELRHQIAESDLPIELFGRGSKRPIQDKEEGLNDYMFSVVIENSRAPGYFTEKILDCFATRTVPVYWGCPNIAEYFNPDGVIVFNSLDDLRAKWDLLTPDSYESRQAAVAENLWRCEQYKWPEDWIVRNVIERVNL